MLETILLLAAIEKNSQMHCKCLCSAAERLAHTGLEQLEGEKMMTDLSAELFI